MAKPIKETPVLTGDDAIRFEKEQAKQAFDYFSSIATFSL